MNYIYDCYLLVHRVNVSVNANHAGHCYDDCCFDNRFRDPYHYCIYHCDRYSCDSDHRVILILNENYCNCDSIHHGGSIDNYCSRVYLPVVLREDWDFYIDHDCSDCLS